VRVVAHNTDVPALAAELSALRPGARTALIVGSGGAALAATAACRSLRTDVAVSARAFRGAAPWKGAEEFRERGAATVPWPEHGKDRESEFFRFVTGSDVIVQTTSDGMHGASDGTTVREIVPWEDLATHVAVYDVVYNPAVTPFVKAARERGLRAESGLGMLVGQAAFAIELWLGARPPAPPLRAAAERELEERARR
jgi:shikimate dehydrogenase